MALSGGQRYTPTQIAGSLVRAGASTQEATTFAGVLHYESRGYTGSFGYQGSENGGALNPNGAFGLAQFNGSRQRDLLNFAGSPSAAANLDTQTAFIYQEAKSRGIDMTSHSDIVNRYEVPRQDLRAGEIRESRSISAGIDQGQLGAPMNSNDPLKTTGGTAGSKVGPDGIRYNADGSIDLDEISTDDLNKNPAVAGGGSPTTKGYGTQRGADTSGTNTTKSNSGGGAAGSMTVPQAIDTQTRGNASNTSSLNDQSKANTEALNKTSTANTKAGTDKAQSLYDSATGSLSDYFIRLVFIVVGIIALAGALMLFSKPKQLIQMAAKAAA